MIETTEADQQAVKEQLLRTLLKYAASCRQNVDPHQLKEAVAALDKPAEISSISAIASTLGLESSKVLKRCDPARLPALVAAETGWGLVLGRQPSGLWVVGSFGQQGEYSEEQVESFANGSRFTALDFRGRFVAHQSHSLRLILSELFRRPKILFELALAGIFMMLLAISVSLFSIQVYDRVIPADARATLLVLASGVLLALCFELVLKFARSGVVERLVDQVDQRLARDLMSRFLGVRMESMPQSVGSATQTLKGYDTVRTFLLSLLTVVTVDMPIALFLLLVIFLIGGPLGYIPLLFLLLGILLAIVFRRKAEALAGLSQTAHSRKTGILVETVEGAETLKANNARWRMLSQWLTTTDQARDVDNRFRQVSENAQFSLMFFQQIAYVSIIAVGALLVIDGGLSLGGLIGCSILFGRVLTPVSQLPSLTVNWAHAKSALKALEHYWKLPQESAATSAVFVEKIQGGVNVKGVQTPCYGPGTMTLDVSALNLKAGERVGVVGAVGSGKSSLLRLSSGLIHAQTGQVQLGGLNIEQYDRATLAQHIGYVSQDARLISGTLRENLILGLSDPGDDVILEQCDLLGVTEFVLNTLPKGLDTTISETGAGLSGGQKQLIHLARALLKRPQLLVLDEPTASLDQQLEVRVANTIRRYLDNNPSTTLMLVTHKIQLLSLVDRLLVMAAGRLGMDGARDEIIQTLNRGNPQ